MVDDWVFAGTSFPSPIESTFDKVISIGWYDGTTSGLALDSQHAMAFRFDLVDWGPCQEQRVFALSRLAVSEFEKAVKLLSELKTPNWPVWYPGWPSEPVEQSRMGSELDAILLSASSPELVFASERRFETILAARRLTEQALATLPAKFDDQPSGEFDYWQKFLELPV